MPRFLLKHPEPAENSTGLCVDFHTPRLDLMRINVGGKETNAYIEQN